jgi:hypothetical protein
MRYLVNVLYNKDCLVVNCMQELVPGVILFMTTGK